ncbi:MAG: DNA-processing protein DprA [Firmicutes bacterium]|nr:DNA-processing protein DprA [Bacillota bacterium]
MNPLAYLLALNRLPRLSPGKLAHLLDLYQGDAAAVWTEYRRWPQLISISADAFADIQRSRQTISPQELYYEYLQSGVSVVTYLDAEYPPELRLIEDPPCVLFYKGRLPKPGEPALALIGSRHASGYGRQVAEILARDLAYQGYTIVSGMARGIDSFCHQAALKAGGRTVAVLGSGLDVIYPRENAALYRQIYEQGAVISEFPLGTAALSYNFPRRNRIISALALGVVVIEAGLKSGTLRTVDYALEQGKDVFAVPGPITSASSRGTNRLLRDGAKIVLSAEDVWREYQEAEKPKPQAAEAAGEEEKTLSVQEKELFTAMLLPLHFDRLSQISGMDAAALASWLTIMEIRGLVRQLPGNYYQAVVKKI